MTPLNAPFKCAPSKETAYVYNASTDGRPIQIERGTSERKKKRRYMVNTVERIRKWTRLSNSSEILSSTFFKNAKLKINSLRRGIRFRFARTCFLPIEDTTDLNGFVC